ncbi:MAG: TRAP transporter small permease [Tagaea sp.]|nr:TRAP transporter small permease [Tagaea sp.]
MNPSAEPDLTPPFVPLLERVAGVFAALGGVLAIGVAVLVCASVLGRWLFSAPVRGDFEFVRIATALAVFAYLPYTQARRANINVDTFTQFLPPRVNAAIDGVWDLVFSVAMGFCAYGLYLGAWDAKDNWETTIELQLQLWPVILTSAVLCGCLSFVAFLTALLRFFGRS